MHISNTQILCTAANTAFLTTDCVSDVVSEQGYLVSSKRCKFTKINLLVCLFQAR